MRLLGGFNLLILYSNLSYHDYTISFDISNEEDFLLLKFSSLTKSPLARGSIGWRWGVGGREEEEFKYLWHLLRFGDHSTVRSLLKLTKQ